MKKIKNYIAPDLAKKKIARYKYWSIKDETGITITSSEDSQDGRSFAEILDKIIADNVDAEIQVKFGTNEASSRQNTPIFIRINQEIEWVEPEEEETIKINGVPHKVDRNGNVNINLTSNTKPSTVEATPVDNFRHEMEVQLEGLRKENELQKVYFNNELQSKLMEQNLTFKEMMLSEREARILEKEQLLAQQEAILEEKQKEIGDDVKSYMKHIPKALGGIMKDWLKNTQSKEALGKTKPSEKVVRTKVKFDFNEGGEEQETITNEEQEEPNRDKIIQEEINKTEIIESEDLPQTQSTDE